MFGGAKRFRGGENGGAVLPLRRDAIVRAAHERHRRGKAVIHRAHAKHGKILRQRTPHGFLDAATPHGRGELKIEHLVFARPSYGQRRSERHDGMRVEALRKSDGQARTVEGALEKALQIQMRYKAQAAVFAKAQQCPHWQAPS